MRFLDPTLVDERGRTLEKTTAYVPPPVRHGRLPKWLQARIGADSQCRDWFLAGKYRGWQLDAFYRVASTRGWLDHWGTCVYDGQEFFVSEPYPIGPEAITNLLAFCARFHLQFTIHAASNHYPTACLRIMIHPKDGHLDSYLQHEEGYALPKKKGIA